MKINEIIPLGTAGWIPTATRQTNCYLVLTDGPAIVLDAGTGMSRLGEPQLRERLLGVDEIFIFLSHYHLDHIVGLSFLPLFFQGKSVTICGPGVKCCGHDPVTVLEQAFARPVFSLPIRNFPMRTEIRSLEPGINRLPGDLVVTTRIQTHSDPSIGLRLDNVVYVADTGCDPKTVAFAKSGQILIHDAHYDRVEYESLKESASGQAELASHAYVPGVAELARAADVGRLYLTHINPEYSEDRILSMESDAKRTFQESYVARDLQSIRLT